MKRTRLVHAAALALLAGLSLTPSACINMVPMYEAKHTVAAPYQAGAVDVKTVNGDISVAGGSAGSVEIEAKVRAVSQARADQASVSATRDASGALVIRVEWPDGKPRSNEGASLYVKLPEASGVRCVSDNGSITIANLGGKAELSTSNGSVTVAQHGGDVVARTTNGSVEAVRVIGSVEALTTNGSVDVTLAPESKGPVQLTTTNGSVELTVGAAFVGELTASTTNGKLVATGGDVKSAKGKLTVTFGTGGSASRVQSTNGDVVIHKAE